MQSVILAKNSKKTGTRGSRAAMRLSFPQRVYRRRAMAERVYFSLKHKVSVFGPGGNLTMREPFFVVRTGREALFSAPRQTVEADVVTRSGRGNCKTNSANNREINNFHELTIGPREILDKLGRRFRPAISTGLICPAHLREVVGTCF